MRKQADRIIILYMVGVLCLSLFASFSLYALDPDKKINHYKLKIWDMEHDLPGNEIYAILQTRDRYIWLGTGNGLIRFNGMGFKTFTSQNTPQLKDNEIRALFEDSSGTLWIGTANGGLTSYKEQNFYNYSTQDGAPRSIKAIQEDKKGNLWIGSVKKGLSLFNQGVFSHRSPDGILHNEVRYIFKDDNDGLWAAYRHKLIHLHKGNFKDKLPEEIKFAILSCLHNTKSKELWIGTSNGGLFCVKNKKVTGQWLPGKKINALHLDREKNLWICTDAYGVYRLNKGIIEKLEKTGGLLDASVHAINEDWEGNIWIGTLDDGLLQLRDSKFNTYTTKEGLPHNYINCIYQKRNGQLLIGSKNGLTQINRDNNWLNMLAGENVLCVGETSKGALWVGTSRGLLLIEKGKTRDEIIKDVGVRCILEDKVGTWAGTDNGLRIINNKRDYGNNYFLPDISVNFIFKKHMILAGTEKGLYRYIKEENRFVRIPGSHQYSYYCVYKDKWNVLWFGTDSGLVRMYGNRITIYNNQHGLVDNYINGILEDERGRLWLAGKNGISTVDKTNLMMHALPFVNPILPTHYTENNGMESRWCTGSNLKSNDGKFWFPTAEGLSVIDPHGIIKNKQAPKIIIESLSVNDKVELAPHSTKRKPWKIGPGVTRLEISYAGLSFINSQQIEYQYILELEGNEEKWRTGNNRNSIYTNLSPGTYTFKVKAANADGKWSQPELFYFEVKPKFHQTPGFFIAVGFLILLIPYLVHLLKVKRLKEKKKELKALVDIRTKDLQERNQQLENARQKILHTKDLIQSKNIQLETQTLQLTEQSEKLKEMDQIKSRFFANISHEFRTPLTLIMGPLEQMMEESGHENDTITFHLMHRNSQRLLNLINQLLELSKFESGQVQLHARTQDIIPLLKGIVANFEALAQRKKLDISFQSAVDEIFLSYDAEKIEEVVNNLMINAVKFTPAGGTITVFADLEEKGSEMSIMTLSVKDSGEGIPREQLVHIFDRFYQSENSSNENRKRGTGIGLALVKEIVELHQGTIDVFSSEGKGTDFTITLPQATMKPRGSYIVQETGEKSTLPPLHHDVTALLEQPGVTSDVPDMPVGEADMQESGDERELVLVVDDSADVRQYVGGALEPFYKVIEAGDGSDGINKALQYIPDLIVSDVMMPEVNGYELCDTLKKDIKTSHIPIILLTAKAGEQNIVQGLETGADDYVTKPFNTRILIARIKNLIDLRKQLHLNINREMTLQPAKIDLSKIDKEFMQDLKVVISKNIADPEFNVEALAKKMYMDRSTVYRKVLALTGEKPFEFIRSCRLKRGAELLKRNYGTVLEIAFEVGFSSANYFSKCFKKKFNQLPTAYQDHP